MGVTLGIMLGALGVTNITIWGDCVGGAVIKCDGWDACANTELMGECVSDIKGGGYSACHGAPVVTCRSSTARG